MRNDFAWICIIVLLQQRYRLCFGLSKLLGKKIFSRAVSNTLAKKRKIKIREARFADFALNLPHENAKLERFAHFCTNGRPVFGQYPLQCPRSGMGLFRP
jgi:hypothetical protein